MAQVADADEFKSIAARFVAQIPDERLVRIAVFAVPDGAPSAGPALAADVAKQVAAAMGAAPRPSTRRIELAQASAVQQALAAIAGASAEGFSTRAIIEAGRAAAANYVAVATPQGSNGRTQARVLLQFVDVSRERLLDRLTVTMADTRPLLVPRIPTPAPLVMPVSQKPPRFWPMQKVGLATGFGLSAAAAAYAWSQDRDLRQRRRQILTIPAGATDEFNRQMDAAKGLGRTRDFWWGVAAAGAAVTTTYAIIGGSPAIGHTVVYPRRTPRWHILISPFRPGISLARSF
jgi:hypothetical protein